LCTTVDDGNSAACSPTSPNTKRYYNATSKMYFMQHGNTGHGGTPRAGADQVNAAPVRPLIGDALARLSALDSPGWQGLRDGVLPSQQVPLLRHATQIARVLKPTPRALAAFGKDDLRRKCGLAVS
jgi:hypothetical protein